MSRAASIVVFALASGGVAACTLFFPFDDYEKVRPVDATSDSPLPGDAACDANLQTDSLHCGACDHSCLGQRCTGGLCSSEPVFADPSVYALGLALDEDAVYVAGSTTSPGAAGAIVRVPKAAPSSKTTVALLTALPFRVVVTGAELFWTQGALGDAGLEDRGIGRTTKTGGDGGLFAPSLSGQASPYAVALDETSVFWTNFLASGSDVWRAARTGRPEGQPITAPQAAAFVAVDADHVYWTTFLPLGSVMRASKDGSNATAIAENQRYPFAVFVDGENVYWTSFDVEGPVMRMPKGGGTPVEIASSQDRPNAVVADEAFVYWSNVGTPGTSLGNVNRVAKAGGTPLVLAARTAPSDLAIDAARVYWASDGAVFRVPK